MSFVSVFAMENFITVMSDGLVVDLEAGIEVMQNNKKFKMISPKQFVAFGGTHELGKIIFEYVGYKEEERDLGELANFFRDIALNSKARERQKCQVIFAGIEKNQIIFYSFNNNPEQPMLSEAPKGERQTYTMLRSKHVKINPVDKMEKLISIYNPSTSGEALKIQGTLNNIVANNDFTVNENIFKDYIEK